MDEVLPSHFIDDIKVIRSYTLMQTYRFEDVLDLDMLHRALVELFSTDSWRRLGGRLRLRVGHPVPTGERMELTMQCSPTEKARSTYREPSRISGLLFTTPSSTMRCVCV